jgi:virginiamycin B lyase
MPALPRTRSLDMRPPQVRMRILASFLLVAGLVSGCARAPPRASPGPRLRTLSEPRQRFEFHGFSVLPPLGPNWVVIPSFPSPPGISILIAFGRRPDRPPGKRPEDLRTLIAAVATSKMEAPVRTPEEFLLQEEGRTALVIGAQVGPRHRVVSLSTSLDGKLGPSCVRYDYRVEDTGVPQFPGTPFFLDFHGYRCPHPKWPRYVVDVGYSERYLSSLSALAPEAELTPFLESLALTDGRPSYVATIPIGRGPQALAIAGGSVWVAYGDDGLARIDPAKDAVIARVKVGRDPVGVVTGPDGVWVANREDGTISLVDPGTNAVVKTIAVGPKPLLLATDGRSIWIADGGLPGVVRVEEGAKPIVTRIPFGKEPAAVVVAAGAVWVTDYQEDNLLRLDPATGRVGLSVKVGQAPAYVVYGEGSLWVANQHDQTVMRIDPDSGRIVATIPLRTRPTGMALCQGSLWVANFDEGDVSRIDVGSNRVSGEPIPVGRRPVLMLCGPDALWVSNAFGDTVSRIDL